MHRHRSHFRAYALMQVPDVLLAGVVLSLSVRWGWLSAGWASALFIAWVAKDVAVYLVLRSTFRPSSLGPDGLLGARGLVEVALTPCGQVRLRGELWRAQSARCEPIPAGTAVVIREVRGLTLVAEAEREHSVR